MTLKVQKISDKVHENLLKVKKQLDLSARQVSELTSKASSMVCCYFNGTKNPPEPWIDIFCSVYCVDKNWLINGDGEPVFTGEPSASVLCKPSDNVGGRVKQIRKTAELTQTEFGKRIGLSQAGVLSIEKNTTKLTPFTLAKIEEEFDVGADWLMYGDEEKKDFPVSKKLIDWLWTDPDERERLWRKMKHPEKSLRENKISLQENDAQEIDLLKMYRKLSEEKKKCLLDIAKFFN